MAEAPPALAEAPGIAPGPAGDDAADAGDLYTAPIGLEGTVDVKVASWERRTDSDSEWVVFEVLTTAVEGSDAASHFEGTVKVFRRYSDFELLRLYLAAIMPSALLPPLAEKSINFKFAKLGGDRFDPEFLEKRRSAFEKYLNRMLSHARVSQSKAFYSFLKNQSWGGVLKMMKDDKVQTWAPPSLDTKMSKLMSTPKRPHRRFLDYKHYGSEMKSNMTTILNTHNRFAMADHAAQRTNNSFAIAFKSYSEVEQSNTFGDLYAELSEHFDTLADVSSETIKKEEKLVADPLKEFVFYADSLKELLETQEYTQCKYETALNDTAKKRAEIQQLEKPTGVSGFFRSLGTPDKEADAKKKAKLEADLVSLLDADRAKEQATTDFNDEALAELEEFDRVKAIDMRSYFQEYGTIQLATHQQKLDSWEKIKAACTKVRQQMAQERK